VPPGLRVMVLFPTAPFRMYTSHGAATVRERSPTAAQFDVAFMAFWDSLGATATMPYPIRR
jgi:hypothetical protein